MNLKLKLFSVYDTKAEAYFPPFVAGHIGEALRVFQDLLGDPQSRLSKHPGDYRLYSVGSFESHTGVVTGLHEGVVLIEDGLTLVKEA